MTNEQPKIAARIRLAPNKDVVEACEELLELARSGQVQGVFVTIEMEDGDYMTTMAGGCQPMRALGMLERIKWRICQELDHQLGDL